MNKGLNSFRKGLFDGIPIGLGYLAVSFSFGIMGTGYGLEIWQTVIISLTNLTSAGQFAGIGIIAASGTYIEMLITQFVINLRYSLMSIALSQKLDETFTASARIFHGFCITDEIFAVAVSRDDKIGRRYFGGLSAMPVLGWTLGTFLGALSGDLLPERICTALSVALYGMFVAIVVPPMKKERRVLFVVAIAVILSCILYYQPWIKISTGFSVIICAVVSSCIGAWLFPIDDDEKVSKREEADL